MDNNNPLRIILDASFQGLKMLCVLVFNDTTVNDDNNPINNSNKELKEPVIKNIFIKE